jgi:hypothetical protein
MSHGRALRAAAIRAQDALVSSMRNCQQSGTLGTAQ